ncbi:S-phase kinase-associated protein 2-like [Styela clava]
MLNISSLGRCLQVCRLWNKIACISNCLFLTHLNLTLCKEVTISGVIEILLAYNRLTELNLSWSSICRYSPEELVSGLPSTINHLNLGGFRDTMQDGHVAEIVARCMQPSRS